MTRGNLRLGALGAALLVTIVAAPALAVTPTWRVVAMPNPGGSGGANLVAASSSGAASAWAVGYNNNTRAGYVWRAAPVTAGWVHVASPGFYKGELFLDVATWGSKVWVVGTGKPSASIVVTEWTGSAWVNRTPPGISSTQSAGAITVSGANSVWIAGGSGTQPAAWHWNGSAWHETTFPHVSGPGYSSISVLHAVPGTSQVVAGGVRNSQACEGGKAFGELWTGSAWALMTSPTQATNVYQCNYESGPAGSPSWFSVNVARTTGPIHPVLMHRTGSHWSVSTLVTPPGTTGWSIAAIDESSPTSAWAVGRNYTGTTNRPVVEHWNGHGWSLQSVPSPGPDARLYGVTTVPGTCQVDVVGDWWTSVSSTTPRPTSLRYC